MVQKKNSLPRLGNFRVLVEKNFGFVFVAKFQIFCDILPKFSKNKHFRGSKTFEPRYNFCTISNFSSSKWKSSMDGRNFAGAYLFSICIIEKSTKIKVSFVLHKYLKWYLNWWHLPMCYCFLLHALIFMLTKFLIKIN